MQGKIEIQFRATVAPIIYTIPKRCFYYSGEEGASFDVWQDLFCKAFVPAGMKWRKALRLCQQLKDEQARFTREQPEFTHEQPVDYSQQIKPAYKPKRGRKFKGVDDSASSMADSRTTVSADQA